MEDQNSIDNANTQDVETTHEVDDTVKTFTQEEVDEIVQRRLNRERDKLNKLINDEASFRKELQISQIKFHASQKLVEMGLDNSDDTMSLVVSDDEATTFSKIDTLGRVVSRLLKVEIEKKFKENGRNPERGSSYVGGSEDSLRKAFSLK